MTMLMIPAVLVVAILVLLLLYSTFKIQAISYCERKITR